MSYGITPIAVSLAKVESVLGQPKVGFPKLLFGSPAIALVKELKQNFGYRFDQDEIDDDDEPTLEQALLALLQGEEPNEDYPHKYAYAFELLCEHFGEFLNNSAWSAMRMAWAKHVDESLKQVGVDEEKLSVFNHIMFRGPPLKIPTPDDFPSIGYLRNSELSTAAAAIEFADLSGLDEETRESVLQIHSWLTRADELVCDLVCFYY